MLVTICLNSEDDISKVQSYSISGIDSCSASTSISLSSYSETLSCLADSNIRVRVSAFSRALSDKTSSEPQAFKTLTREVRESPRLMFLSHLYRQIG